MNKFVVRLPRNGTHKSSANLGSKKKNSPFSSTNSGSIPSRKRNSTESMEPLKKQSYLDVGQKGLGRTSTCPDCNMIYIVDEDEDRDHHKKFCRKAKQSMAVSTLHRGDIIWESDEVDHVIIKVKKEDCVKKVTTPYFRQFLPALERMYNELGSSPDELADQCGTVYIYLISMQVAGIVVAEQVLSRDLVPRYSLTSSREEGKKKGKELLGDDGDAGDVGGESTITSFVMKKRRIEDLPSKEVSPISAPRAPPTFDGSLIIGIRELWVSSEYRRQAIATQMVERVRGTFQYGAMVSKDSVAFSQPTSLGEAFAFKYNGSGRGFIWTYALASRTS